MNFRQEYSVEKLQLLEFMLKISPDVPTQCEELEKHIETFFLRYFGLHKESIWSKFDTDSFHTQVKGFRKRINEWRVKCKGFSESFKKKPFLKKLLVLREKEPISDEDNEGDFDFEVPDFFVSDEEVSSPKKSKRSFEDLPHSTQRAHSRALRQGTDPDLLAKAVVQNLRAKGFNEAATCVERLHGNPSELGPHLKKCIGEFDSKEEKEDIHVLEVLSLVLNEDMSRNSYNKYRKLVNRKGKILPSYGEVAKAKTKCRPTGITSEEHKVDVPLQNLAEHTVKRILEDEEVAFQIQKLADENGGQLAAAFNFKIGTDGSSGFQVLVEEFEDFQEETTSMVATNFVSLNIWTVINNKIEIVYHNPLFNSSLAVRPKQHLYRREDDIIEYVLEDLKEEMANLQPFEWKEGITINFVPIFSMNDGKIMNKLHGNNWTSACPFCYAGPEQFSDINSVYCANPAALAEMCLSTLHFGPRVMENLLKIGFNQQFKKSQVSTDEDKRMRAESKEHIIKEVKRVLKADIFKGQSNTGNCARTLFKNSIFFADLIGVDEDLVHRIYMIWIALTSGLPIDPAKFYHYCQETKDLYFEQCGWYNMSPTLHKVLEHGHQILELLPPELTVGMLSEEPAEASNKDTKMFQKYHAFQGDAVKKNEQVFHRMMDRSDPFMHSLFLEEHVKSRSKHEEIPEDVLAMCYSDEDLQKRMVVNGGEPSKAQEPSFSFFNNI